MKTVTPSLLLIGFAFSMASCAKKDDPAPEPVKQPAVVAPAPAPVAITPKTNPFRTPEEDLNLPTEAQTAEGADSSIGTGGQPVSVPRNAPSVAVTPPSPAPAPVAAPDAPKAPEPKKPVKKEDQLDPG